MSEMEPLPPELRELLRKGLPDELPGDEVHQRLLARLQLAPGSPDGQGGPPPPAPPAGGTPPAPVQSATPLASKALGALLASKAGFGAAMFVLGSASGAVMHASLSRPPAPVIVQVSATVNSPAPPVGLELSARVALVAPDTSSLPSVASATSFAVPAVSSAAPSAPLPAASVAQRDESLGAERACLDMARSALARGQAQDALQALARHQAEFSRPRLSEEREALAIQALLRAGRAGKARSRFERYRRAYPRSMMLPTLEALTGSP